MSADQTPERPLDGELTAAPGNALQRHKAMGLHAVVMGVAGCGKSAVAKRIALVLELPVIEGDDFHPPANKAKMEAGIALDDDDRVGWLQTLASELARHPHGAVLTCSALKASYRAILRSKTPALRFVHLAITPEESLRRVAKRANHFYPPSLVASQFEALQDPSGEPGVLVLDGSAPKPDVDVAAIAWLSL